MLRPRNDQLNAVTKRLTRCSSPPPGPNTKIYLLICVLGPIFLYQGPDNFIMLSRCSDHLSGIYVLIRSALKICRDRDSMAGRKYANMSKQLVFNSLGISSYSMAQFNTNLTVKFYAPVIGGSASTKLIKKKGTARSTMSLHQATQSITNFSSLI